MAIKRLAFAALAASALLPGAIPAGRLEAQVTTGSISGVVTNQSGQPVDGAQVQVINRETGASRGAVTRGDGRYTTGGLEVGRNYAVVVRRIGFAPVTREGVRITLGQTTRLDVSLTSQAATLQAVEVTAAAASSVINPTKTGVSTTFGDSAIRRLPTLNRNFTDFVQLTPQVSTNNGFSAAGVNNRYNSIQIDGANSTDAFGLGSTGQPGGQAGGRSISILAVKEYQVLLSPYDVRQGGFAGLLVNAVTQNGTNDFRAIIEGYGRNTSTTRDQPYLSDFRTFQYAGSVGGPIVRDKAFFFLTADVTRQQQNAAGPYLGSSDQTVSNENITRFTQIAQSQYGLPAGSAAGIVNKNPLTNLFGRLDFNLPGGNRLVVRHNYAAADQDNFGRSTATASQPVFGLSSNQYFFRSRSNQTVAQLYSSWSSGATNELLLGYSTIRDARATPVQAPQVSAVVPRLGGTGTAQLRLGSENSSQLNSLAQNFVDITDNLTVPLGAHRITVGTQNRLQKFNNVFGQNAFGNWTFNSLDSLARDTAASYQVGVPSAINNGAAIFNANNYSAYVQDEYAPTKNFNLSLGLRADVPTLVQAPPYNRGVDSVYSPIVGYAVRTSNVPKSQVQLSPRVGFNWDVTGDQRNQLRGGAGVFVGSPAYVWIGNAYQNSGLTGYQALSCSGTVTLPSASNPTGTSFLAPTFSTTAIATPPTQCASAVRTVNGQQVTIPGAQAAASSTINTLNPDFKFPQQFKATLGFDRRLAAGWIATFEGLYTKGLNNPFYVNLALPTTPVGVGANGRTIYGTFVSPSGQLGGQPAYVGNRSLVLDLRNQSKDYSYALTGGVQRQFSGRYSASLFYTYNQARDVASYANSVANSNYGLGRSVSGDVLSTALGRSRFEQPHRVVASFSYRAPTNTDFTVFYTGQSGQPFDFNYGGSGALGDLNADGQRNDLFYVPTNAADTTQIRFSGTPAQQAAQAAGLERYINATGCLRDQRGRIMTRNSCRSPWLNLVNLRAAQNVGTFRGQNVAVTLEVFNLGNLLNSSWGQQNFVGTVGGTSVPLLTEVRKVLPNGQALTAATPAAQAQQAVGVFQFDTGTLRYNAQNLTSNYQIQLAVRYSLF